LEAYITHCQLLQANGRKEANLKDIITQTKVTMNIEKRSTVESFVQNRLRSDAAATFKASKQYDQEARRIAWTTFAISTHGLIALKSIASTLDFPTAKPMGP